MAYDKKKVIDIALAEVGYLEKESKSNLDSKTANAGDENITKYARDLAAVKYFNGSKQGVAWCATFVSWCFETAYGKSAALMLQCQPSKDNCGAGCNYARNYYKAKGQLHDSPQPGDQVFFYNSSKSSIAHTGLVYDVDGAYVYTVEGNTSSASGVVANGGAVAKKKYKLTNSRIAGYGRPNYGAQMAGNAPQSSPTKPVIKYPTYTVKRGDSLWTIAREQLGKGTRYREIMKLNGLKSDLIKAGEVIKLPVK